MRGMINVRVLKDTSPDGEPGSTMTSGAAPQPGGARVVNQETFQKKKICIYIFFFYHSLDFERPTLKLP